MTDTPLEETVEQKLTEVLDPCSCFTENPVDIVELGLVEDIDVRGDTAHVSLLLTSGACAYLPKMSEDIERRVGQIEGIDEVEVTQVTNKLWTRERMDEQLREDRREWFERQIEASDITPYAERT